MTKNRFIAEVTFKDKSIANQYDPKIWFSQFNENYCGEMKFY